MTTNEQIKALLKVGCTDAVTELESSGDTPLSRSQLKKHREAALDYGFPLRAMVLAELMEDPLSPAEVERVIQRCLQLGWISDALYAASKGQISGEMRQTLMEACITNGLADNPEEAAQLLKDDE